MKIVVTGGTGFIGRHLLARLRLRGDTVHVLTRSSRPDEGAIRYFTWDPMQSPPPEESIDESDAVIHLSGEPLMRRWSPEVKRQLRESRVTSTRRLIEGLSIASKRPAVLISGSAIGYYGERGDEVLVESSPAGEGFLARLAQDWENAAQLAEALGIRTVFNRTGLVIGKDGGLLKGMLPVFRWGLGGELASGKQWMSWIHVSDVVSLMLHAISNPNISGPVNATAPNPVRNAEFTRVLAATVRRPALFRVPKFALQIKMGEVARYAVESQRVIPEAALQSGYSFHYAELEPALADATAS